VERVGQRFLELVTGPGRPQGEPAARA